MLLQSSRRQKKPYRMSVPLNVYARIVYSLRRQDTAAHTTASRTIEDSDEKVTREKAELAKHEKKLEEEEKKLERITDGLRGSYILL